MPRGTWLLVALLAVTATGCSGTFLPNLCHPGTIQEQQAVFSRFDPYPSIDAGSVGSSETRQVRPRETGTAPLSEQSWLYQNEYAPLQPGPPRPLAQPTAVQPTTVQPTTVQPTMRLPLPPG